MRVPGARQASVFALFLLGTLAVLQHGMGPVRLGTGTALSVLELVVSNPGDEGPGTLREAIFAAARSERRARIAFRVPALKIETPLPTLFNPRGVELGASDTPVEVDAEALRGGVLLDVSSPDTAIRGLRVRGAGVAILLRARDAVVEDVRIVDGGDGVLLLDGSRGSVVRASRFEGNEVGVRVLASDPQIEIRGNHFEGQREAAIWAVRAERAEQPSSRPLSIRKNASFGDRRGLVLGHAAAHVARNRFTGALDTAVLLLNAQGRLEDNRIRDGEGIGLFVDESAGTRIMRNEVDHNRVAGILVRSAGGVELRSNEIHANGYGIIAVFDGASSPLEISENLVLDNRYDGIVVIGATPIVQANRSIGNRRAGLRLVDYVRRSGTRELASPLLERNVWQDNELDQPVREEWLEPEAT